MSALYDKHAKEYSDSRPSYPASLFSMLASLTANHQLAWDVGAGNGQASVSIAEHYDRVIATDISKGQLELAQKHPKVTYAHTTPAMTNEELSAIVGEEGSVDLVTVATAVHWFDLETFYSQVKRVLRKPGGVIAVWIYGIDSNISPAVDAVFKDFVESAMPYWNPGFQYALEAYKTLPFPFEPVLENGRGSEGNPMEMEMVDIQMSLDKYLKFLTSSSAVAAAKEKGIELLNDKVSRMFKEAWGDESTIYSCKLPVYMLAGTSPVY